MQLPKKGSCCRLQCGTPMVIRFSFMGVVFHWSLVVVTQHPSRRSNGTACNGGLTD